MQKEWKGCADWIDFDFSDGGQVPGGGVSGNRIGASHEDQECQRNTGQHQVRPDTLVWASPVTDERRLNHRKEKMNENDLG